MNNENTIIFVIHAKKTGKKWRFLGSDNEKNSIILIYINQHITCKIIFFCVKK